MTRILEYGQAVDYLNTIEKTYEEVNRIDQSFGRHPQLKEIVNLVRLERAYFLLLSERGEPKEGVLLSATGFPAIEILLTHAEAAIHAYEPLFQKAKEAMTAIIFDFSLARPESLIENAPERTRTITSTTEFTRVMRLTSRIDRQYALDATQYWKEQPKREKKPNYNVLFTLSEEQELLVEQFYGREYGWLPPVGFKFIHFPRPGRENLHHFFIVFLAAESNPWRGNRTLRPYEFIPDYSRAKEEIATPLKKRMVTVYSRDEELGKFVNRKVNDPLGELLKKYNPVRYEGYNQEVFNFLLEINRALTTLSKIQDSECHQDAQALIAFQYQLAVIINKINSFPSEIASMLKDAINDTVQFVYASSLIT